MKKDENGFDDWIKKNFPQQIVTETDKAVYIDGFKVGFVASTDVKKYGNFNDVTIRFFAKDYIDKKSKRTPSSANEECPCEKLSKSNSRNITNKDNKMFRWNFGRRVWT